MTLRDRAWEFFAYFCVCMAIGSFTGLLIAFPLLWTIGSGIMGWAFVDELS